MLFKPKRKDFDNAADSLDIKVYEEREADLLSLQAATKSILSDVSNDIVAQSIVNLMVERLSSSGGVLFLKDSTERFLYPATISDTKIVNTALSILPKKATNYQFSLSPNAKNLVGRSVRNDKVIVSEKLSAVFGDVVNSRLADLMQRIVGAKSVIVVPVKIKEEVIGAVLLTYFLKKIPTHKLDILKLFSDMVGIAIYNSQLFDEIQSQVKALDNKTKDLSALLDISKVAISSVKTEKVVQELLNSVPEKMNHLQYTSATFVQTDKNKKQMSVYAITASELTAKALKVLPKNIREYTLAINENNDDPITKTLIGNEIVISDDLGEAFGNVLTRTIAKKIQKIGGVQSLLNVPVQSRGEVIGVVIFACSKPVSEVNDRDRDIVTNFSNNLGLAYENAELYRQLEGNLKELATKTKALESANTQLKKFDQAKSEFISIASHQLRTPLTVIKGYLSMIDESFFGEVPDKIRETVDKLLRSTDRLINLVNDLLDISRIETGHMHFNLKKMSIKQLVTDLADGMTRIANEKGLELKRSISDEVPDMIVGDDAKLREVLSNLIDNAIKYTDKGSIEVILKKDDGHVEFIVQDTGQGIMKKDLPRLFQKFARGEGMHVVHTEGTGLGLFVCKKIVEAHKGKIWAESEGKNKGSRFTVKLPIDLPEGEVVSKREEA